VAILVPGSFDVTIARVFDRVVIRVAGELDAYTAPTLRQSLRDIIEDQGNLNIVVDLSVMTFIDSTGLGVLVGALRNVRQRGGDLVLSAPSASALKVLEITGLEHAFTITHT
jgi:anti-sigma B factor antagonist